MLHVGPPHSRFPQCACHTRGKYARSYMYDFAYVAALSLGLILGNLARTGKTSQSLEGMREEEAAQQACTQR